MRAFISCILRSFMYGNWSFVKERPYLVITQNTGFVKCGCNAPLHALHALHTLQCITGAFQVWLQSMVILYLVIC